MWIIYGISIIELQNHAAPRHELSPQSCEDFPEAFERGVAL